MKVSVIMSSRNEFPDILYTCHSILDDLSSFLKPQDFEIIIVNNCSDDEKIEKRADGGTTDYISTRGAYHNGIIKVMYYPFASNVGARNYGVKYAKGDYIFFSDAHMIYGQGTFKRLIESIDESGGIVHPAVSWIGAFPPQKGYQYSLKLGEEFKGTWNNYLVTDKSWFYVPAMGHCCLGMKKKQFEEFGGYIENRCYGGGELYLDSLWWMMGSTSITEPRVNVYHLSSGRGYNYNHDDYIHNIFASGLSLGADGWVERAYLNYLRKGKKEVLDKLLVKAGETAKPHREIPKKKSFNDLLVERPWDKLNDKKLGNHYSGMLIYQETWLNLIKGTIVETLYNVSQLQKELAEFINKNLSQYVYKRNS